jgi:hypothetical protein
MASGPKVQQTGRAGEYYVAAELNRRGAYAVTFAGNMPMIQVKTRRKGTWHSNNKEGKKSNRKPNETKFWIFVDIERNEEPPIFYIVPDWWIRNDIHEKCVAYIKKYKGKQSSSTHHGIDVKRIERWKDRWDILRIF